ncbi:MAG: helix-turn-helix domain-containing protein [Halanaerobiales bacterium]
MTGQLKDQLGNVLKELRKDRGLTLRELGKEAGVSATLISDIENGRYYPSLKTLSKLSNALEVKISQIFFAAESGKCVNKE